jgi:hypothetical protein
MNRFDDLRQRVTLLNAQLEPVKDHLGSEVRQMLYSKLWAVVEELNTMLNLCLENTALELTVDGDRLMIHYWSGVGGSVENEVRIFIDRSFAVEKHTTDLGTSSVSIAPGTDEAVSPAPSPARLLHDIPAPRPISSSRGKRRVPPGET